MCSNCRGRFGLPVVSNGVCEVCSTLNRLNRVVLTRHPAEESDTLLKLLQRTTSKVEAFVEEWEANQALGLSGGFPLTTTSKSSGPAGGSAALGLTPAAKKSSLPGKRQSEGSPLRRREGGEEAKKRSRERSGHRSEKRSPSKKEKKEKKRKRHQKREEERENVEREKEEQKEKKKRELAVRPPTPEAEQRASSAVEEISEESSTREDRRSPLRRRDVGPAEEPAKASSARASRRSPSEPKRREEEPRHREVPNIPRSPSRSPPGFRRADYRREDYSHQEVRDKPKKDKGYNHYLRGREFRDKYGFDRGRGRGYHGYGR